LGGIAPNVLQFLDRYKVTIYEMIEEGLAHGIGKLDNNISHFPRESWVPNQCEAELRVLVCPVPLSKRNKIRIIKSCKHRLYGILSNRAKHGRE